VDNHGCERAVVANHYGSANNSGKREVVVVRGGIRGSNPDSKRIPRRDDLASGWGDLFQSIFIWIY
jgi:hypothetical protein